MKWQMKIDGELIPVHYPDRKEAELARRDLRRIPDYAHCDITLSRVHDERTSETGVDTGTGEVLDSGTDG